MVLTDSIVLISSKSQRNNTIGTGFIIHQAPNKTYVLTCFHVVDDVEGPDNVLADGTPATMIAWDDKDGFDLAVLVTEKLCNKPALELSSLCKANRLFGGAGYTLQAGVPLTMNLFGTIYEKRQIWSKKLKKNTDGWNLTIDPANPLKEGNSGSPVIELLSKSVVGVVTTMVGGEKGSAVSIDALKEIWLDMPQNLISSNANDEISLDLSNETQEEEILLLSFPIFVTAGILLIISILSLLASYVWYSSVPWKIAYQGYGWLIEASRSVLIILEVLFLIRPYFSQEIKEFFGFSRYTRENKKIVSLIRFITIVMSFAGCFYLYKHHFDIAPHELAQRASCWANNGIIEKENAPPLEQGRESYFVPYQWYFLYSCIIYLFLIFPTIALVIYSVVKDLFALIKYKSVLREKIIIIETLSNKNNISNFINKKLYDFIEINFENFENNYIKTIKKYTYFFLVVVFVFAYELFLGHITLSIRASIGALVAAAIIFVVLFLIFLGFLHYEDAYQYASNSITRITATSSNDLTEHFQQRHNALIFFFHRIIHEFLSISLGTFLLFISLFAFLIYKNFSKKDPCSIYILGNVLDVLS